MVYNTNYEIYDYKGNKLPNMAPLEGIPPNSFRICIGQDVRNVELPQKFICGGLLIMKEYVVLLYHDKITVLQPSHYMNKQ